jgi:hypothetical protein
MLKRSQEMAELFFQHDEITYIYDTKLLKLYRLEGNRSIEISSPETLRNVRLFSSEISRKQALEMVADRCPN